MKRAIVVVLFLGIATAWAQQEEQDHPYLKYHPLDVRLGIGGTLDPSTFLLVISPEYNVDRFLALGMIEQIAVKTDNTMAFTTFGGRFTIPLYFTQRMETSLQSGIGFVYRDTNGFYSTHFAYEFGLNIDTYVAKNVAVGIGGIINVTSSSADRSVYSLFANASYRY